MGENITELLNYTTIENISRWLSIDIPPERISDYIYAKALHPPYYSCHKR